MTKQRSGLRLLVILLWVALGSGLTGCLRVTPLNPEQSECLGLFQQLDQAALTAGCRNAAYHRNADFPWLRSSRYWSAIGESVTDESLKFWLGQLEQLDEESRVAEQACAPPIADTDVARLKTCRALLRPLAMSNAEALKMALEVPDEYSLLRRTIGLYPVAYPFVAWGAYNAYEKRREWFRRDLSEFTVHGSWQIFRPESGTLISSAEVADLLQRSAANPMAIPLPDEDSLRALAKNFAPVFVQQQEGARDRFGAPVWREGQLLIDTAVPTVYYYADHLLHGGTSRLRINYVIWFPERGGEKTPWIEAGNFDGVNVGIVLDTDGRILASEVMNNCGCYHSFFPGPGLGRQKSFPLEVDPLVPQSLPPVADGERLGFYLIGGWHQAVRAVAVAPGEGESYRLRDYAELERIPLPGGGERSMFDGDGIMPQSARSVERILFYSMGIKNVGAMRQRGRQPITLLGREHYDEPNLLLRNFDSHGN